MRLRIPFAHDADRDRNKELNGRAERTAAGEKIESGKEGGKNTGSFKATKFLKATRHRVSPPFVKHIALLRLSSSLSLSHLANETRYLIFFPLTLRHALLSFRPVFSPSLTSRLFLSPCEEPPGILVD